MKLLLLASFLLSACFNTQNSFSNDQRENPNLPQGEGPQAEWFSKVQLILNSPRHCCVECHAFPETEAEFFANSDYISADLNPLTSPLYQRVKSTDPDFMMPAPGDGDPLSKDEVEMIRKWIARGPLKEELP